MVYSLLRDQAYLSWHPMLQKEDGTSPTLSDVAQALDDDLARIERRIAAEPLVWCWHGETLAAAFLGGPDTAEPGVPAHVTKIRLPRAGKPDPATWGWTPGGDGTTPPGIDP